MYSLVELHINYLVLGKVGKGKCAENKRKQKLILKHW